MSAADAPSRRQAALGLLAAALGGSLGGCGKPDEEILPYAEMPERVVPGVPLRFATALPLNGYGRGVLCTYRGCEGARQGRCPQSDRGCTREASDEVVAAISLLLAPADRFAQAIKRGKMTVSAVIAAEEQAIKKVRSRKGISRARKVKKRAD